LHDNALRRRKQTATAVAFVIYLRPRRQILRLLVRHQGTPPNAFARDSWLAAGFLARGLSPSTTFPETRTSSSGFVGRRLSAYSCGGSRGIVHWCGRTAFPWIVLADTTGRKTDIRCQAGQHRGWARMSQWCTTAPYRVTLATIFRCPRSGPPQLRAA